MQMACKWHANGILACQLEGLEHDRLHDDCSQIKMAKGIRPSKVDGPQASTQSQAKKDAGRKERDSEKEDRSRNGRKFAQVPQAGAPNGVHYGASSWCTEWGSLWCHKLVHRMGFILVPQAGAPANGGSLRCHKLVHRMGDHCGATRTSKKGQKCVAPDRISASADSKSSIPASAAARRE
jgi:hypothetical protein